MKQKRRYRKKPKGDGLVQQWPSQALAPENLAAKVSYVGSGEHKKRPLDSTYGIEPALRSDASHCDPKISRDQAEHALRCAIRSQIVSEQFEGGFPRYVWALLGGQAHVARLINREAGEYKGWPIEEHELPTDRELRFLRAWGEDV